jgi:hypothetical protein
MLELKIKMAKKIQPRSMSAKKRLENAMKIQSTSLLIANATDVNLEKLAVESMGQISIELNGTSEKTYKDLLAKSNSGKYKGANLFVVENEQMGKAEGSFYNVPKNLYQSENFSTNNLSYDMSKKGQGKKFLENKDLFYVTLNR